MHPFKYLVIADDSAEFPKAALYAGLRAKLTGSGLVILSVAEPGEWTHWKAVDDQFRRDALDQAEARAARFAAEVWADSGVEAELRVREGELRPELRRLIEEDVAIKILVLGARAGGDPPGSLVASLAAGSGAAGRALPVVVVPGALSREEIRGLALPSEAP